MKNSEEGALSVNYPLHILKQPTHRILLYFSKTFQGCSSLPISSRKVCAVAVKENLQQASKVYCLWVFVWEYMDKRLSNAQRPLMSRHSACWEQSLAHDYGAREKQYQPTGFKCFFQLPPIRNSSSYCPLQRTHSCCPPTNLNTLQSSTHISWKHTKTYQLLEKNLGDVSFESIESHFRHQNRALHLSRCKGGTVEDVETKWVFAEGPLLLDDAKLFSFWQKRLSWTPKIATTRDG